MWQIEDKKNWPILAFTPTLLQLLAAYRPCGHSGSLLVLWVTGLRPDRRHKGQAQRSEDEMGGQGERQAKLPLFTWPRKMCSVELHTFPFCQSTNKYFSQTTLNPGVLLFLLFLTKRCSEKAHITFAPGLQTTLQDAFTGIVFMPKGKIKEGYISNIVIPLF